MASGKKKEAALSTGERLEAALVPVGEQPYQVPENWQWVVLGNLIDIKRGASPRPIKAFVTDDENGVNWIKIGDADSSKYISRTKERINQDGAKKSVFVESGTLLLSNSMSFGRPYILKISGCIHDGWLAITPSKLFNKEYLYYALLASEWYFEQVAVGTAVRNLNSDRVAGTPIVLPPLAEQQRIVDRIESLFSKLDEAKEKAQEALDSFGIRKAAILQQAFDGKLTENWRERHPFSVISDAILSDKKPFEISENYPCDLPDTWKWYRMGGLGYTNIGLTYSPSDKTDTGIIVLRSSNIQNGRMDYGDIVRVSCFIPENKMCREGDILICARNGSKALVGKTAIVDKDGMSFGAFMAIFRSEYNHYLYYFLNSPFFRNLIDQDVGTTTINQVTQAIIKELPVSFAPVDEQEEIVRLLDAFFAREAEAKAQVEATLEAIDLMKKSILAKAFRGQLGTNDPMEESAEALLREILG